MDGHVGLRENFEVIFNIFKGKSSKGRRAAGDTTTYDSLKAYKVWPSDEDKGQYVADPGIDKKASVYISETKIKWEKVAVPTS